MAYRELRISLREFVEVEEESAHHFYSSDVQWKSYVRKKLQEAGFKFSLGDNPWNPFEDPKLKAPWCIDQELHTGWDSFIRIRQWDRNEEVPWYSQDRKEMLRWNILQRSRELASSLRSSFVYSVASLRSWLAPILTWREKLGQWLRKH